MEWRVSPFTSTKCYIMPVISTKACTFSSGSSDGEMQMCLGAVTSRQLGGDKVSRTAALEGAEGE